MSVQPPDSQPEAEGVLSVTFEPQPDSVAPQPASQEQELQPLLDQPTHIQPQAQAQAQLSPLEPQPEAKPQAQPQSQLQPPPQPQPQSQPQPQQLQAIPTPSVPPAPLSEWDLLRNQLQESPFDTALWNKLVDKAEESGDIEKIKTAYESLLEKYPNTSTAQIAYLNHFLTNPASFPFAESLFARFLRNSASVELWKHYIVYVRRVNTGPNTRDTVRKAYEFALRHVGQDKDSGELWSEYIQYVKSGEATTTWEEQQKMDALRKIYHRAVQIPLDNVESIWRELDVFENGLNKITAKKFLSDLNPAYMTARTALRELRQHMARLFPPPPPSSSGRPTIILPQKPTYSMKERELMGAWKSYLKWEESNPLDIEDKGTLNMRMQGVYQKALSSMRFHPEMWFTAWSWTSTSGKADDAVNLLKTGLEANPTSPLLNFCYTEQMELQKNFTEVHAAYDKFLRQMAEILDGMEARETAEKEKEKAGMDAAGADGDANKDPLTNGKDNSFSSQKSADEKANAEEFTSTRKVFGNIYIMYIRFALRAEGVEASRQVFAKARKDKWTPWEVFEAAAHMEYHVAKQLGVANKILGLAHTRFPDEIDFVVRYLGFLMSVNDENNARALFERAVTQFPPDKVRPLWERWARYEYQYGNLEASLKLEQRMMEVFPNDPPLKRFAQRHTYLQLDAIAHRDLGFPLRPQSGTPLGRTETLTSITPSATTSLALTQNQNHNQLQPQASKRAASPERARRDDGSSADAIPPHKRSRPISPPPPRERDRRETLAKGGGGGGRRYGSPAGWDRDRERERERTPPRRSEYDEPKRPLPLVLHRFLSQLPAPVSFDGPVFRTDDLMQLFRNAAIPTGGRPRSPGRSGRPPPDYGPYHGPPGRGRRH